MSYRAYPDYRPSGINGLGDLPATWKARRLRFLVHGIDQGWSPRASNVPAEEDELGVLKLSAVSGGHFDATENKQLDEVPEGQVSELQTLMGHKDFKTLWGYIEQTLDARREAQEGLGRHLGLTLDSSGAPGAAV